MAVGRVGGGATGFGDGVLVLGAGVGGVEGEDEALKGAWRFWRGVGTVSTVGSDTTGACCGGWGAEGGPFKGSTPVASSAEARVGLSPTIVVIVVVVVVVWIWSCVDG